MLTPTGERDRHGRDEQFLGNYATERWECILQFMVGNRTETISPDTVKTLINGSLIDYDFTNPSIAPKITSAGFQFLLMNTRDQVWYFMLHYLDTVEAKGFCFVDSLSFLLQLSFSAAGKDYSMEGLSENLLQFLQNLREFGLIYQRKRKDGRFYPTRLVINLTNYVEEDAVLEKASKDEDGFLIVETNYRVYAYTDSPLRIALLSLFVELKYRFPKFCLGYLTRDSVRKALRSGITAEQIINFLNMNCHIDMGKNGTKRQIPPTVMDQVRLWEIERDRFVFKDGVLYSQFLSQSDFELLRNYANVRQLSIKLFPLICNPFY
jgi:transcription initiation factor TFIIH subunit 4